VSVVAGVHAHGRDPDSILECRVADLEGCEEGRWGGGEGCPYEDLLGGGVMRSVGRRRVAGRQRHCGLLGGDGYGEEDGKVLKWIEKSGAFNGLRCVEDMAVLYHAAE
jgi:hypothetical protein